MGSPTISTILLISLGPVQDFVHAARRCQDLWFGSWLLSDLSRTVGRAVSSRGADAQVVFPAGLDADEPAGSAPPGVANLILAHLPPNLNAPTIAREALAEMQARLDEIRREAFRPIWSDCAFHRDTALQQIDELMEAMWVTVPVSGSFAAARRAAYGRLAAGKNTRLWKQPKWNAMVGVPKDSFSGTREAVVQRGLAEGRSAEVWRGRFGLKKGEQLCGVGLLKRLGVALEESNPLWGRHFRPAFHSTSHMAMVPLMARIAACPDGDDWAVDYLNELEELGLDLGRFQVREGQGPPTLAGLDGSLLLETRMAEYFEEASSLLGGARDDAVSEAQSALRRLLRAVDIRGDGPTRYYAFLIADGDRMGLAIDGIPTMEGQVALGTALNDFASGCRGVVARHEGSLIFAGGDDVIALLPLDRAVACTHALATAFQRTVQPVVDAHWQRPEAHAVRPQTTLSAGLAVVHALEDMGQARAIAARAEALAKTTRNALAIIMSMRSGGECCVAGTWNEPTPLDARLARWVDVVREGRVSARAAHDLETIADHFAPLSVDAQRRRIPELRSLIRHALVRKRAAGGSAIDAEALADLTAALEWTNQSAVQGDLAPSERLRRVSAELQIARLIARAAADREGDLA